MIVKAEISDDYARLLRFLRLLMIGACIASAAYLGVAVAVGSTALYVTGFVTASLVPLTFLATRLVRAGRAQTGVLITCYGLLVAVVIVTPLAAFAYATLVLVAVASATVAIAFLPPRRTPWVIVASVAVAIYCVALGLWRGAETALPGHTGELLVMLTVVVLVYLISYTMIQLRSRLAAGIRASQELSARLESDCERARDADRRKDEFLALVSHELRNPLSPIFTALELMRDHDGRSSREGQIIERQARHMARLVDDLLDVSRITRGKLALRCMPVELASVVKQAVEMAEPLVEARRQALSVEVPERGLVVNADPMRLAQIVTNLLSNAAKYTQEGGHVALRAERVDGRARIEVRDDGVGLTPDLVSRIFEPFFQAGASADGRRRGLGLGLTLARELTELHGGRIEAKSEGPGRGTTMTVTLPLASEAALAEPVAREPEPEGAAGRKVLIVDDNEDAADLLALALSRHGFDTRVAHDGPEALHVAAEDPPDAAVLDIGLPAMDGYELARRLRAQLGDRPLKLIALTGYSQASDRERAAEAGFAVHLVKPVDLRQLEHCLSSGDQREERAEPQLDMRN